MPNREALEALFRKHGYADFTWIDPKDIVVAQWVRVKRRFGCDEYGHTATCPPNTASVEECRRFFDEYSTAARDSQPFGKVGTSPCSTAPNPWPEHRRPDVGEDQG